ncbi:DUF4936 family protein [Ideonella sp.]|uniref:DUF4936 family protein n=1 Tax=Ideonella sp. TaxID=1929293 RepID=UPI0035B17732
MSHLPASPPVDSAAERWWFIYYRVHLADLAAVVAAAREGQRALCGAHPGLTATLMQRPSSAASPDSPPQMTMLETYRAPLDWPADRVAAMPAAIDHALGAALAPWLQGPRHLEVFEPCA